MATEARLIVDCRCQTGEGVLWNHLRQEIFWFDIPGKILYSARPDGSEVKARPLDWMGSAAGIVDRDTLVVAAQGGIFRYDLATEGKTRLVELEPDLPRVRGFAGELNQIWGNLIDNALDAVPQAGRVEVRAGRRDGRILVRVADNGSGIPVHRRADVLRPLARYRTDVPGHGIGLATCQRIATDHGGSLELRERPGGGTIVVATFPCCLAS